MYVEVEKTDLELVTIENKDDNTAVLTVRYAPTGQEMLVEVWMKEEDFGWAPSRFFSLDFKAIDGSVKTWEAGSQNCKNDSRPALEILKEEWSQWMWQRINGHGFARFEKLLSK